MKTKNQDSLFLLYVLGLENTSCSEVGEICDNEIKNRVHHQFISTVAEGRLISFLAAVNH